MIREKGNSKNPRTNSQEQNILCDHQVSCLRDAVKQVFFGSCSTGVPLGEFACLSADRGFGSSIMPP
ncbi:MAG: hypothetical protein IIB44_09335 [Candidatus Marinimicrobia bacterium]|nr:hypothetical protein [Candidatus Neomarinimicrobiota bacterium]